MLQKVNGKWMFTDSVYSFGKRAVQIYIPAFSSLYYGLGNIWGFPYITQVVGSCAVIATFFGVLLGISSKQFDSSEAGYDGAIKIIKSPKTGKKTYSLDLKGDPEDIDKKTSVKFKVPKS